MLAKAKPAPERPAAFSSALRLISAVIFYLLLCPLSEQILHVPALQDHVPVASKILALHTCAGYDNVLSGVKCRVGGTSMVAVWG